MFFTLPTTPTTSTLLERPIMIRMFPDVLSVQYLHFSLGLFQLETSPDPGYGEHICLARARLLRSEAVLLKGPTRPYVDASAGEAPPPERFADQNHGPASGSIIFRTESVAERGMHAQNVKEIPA